MITKAFGLLTTKELRVLLMKTDNKDVYNELRYRGAIDYQACYEQGESS
jgi:hypothetical protein